MTNTRSNHGDEMNDVSIHFEGPLTFGAGPDSLFQSPLAGAAGVYLWTFRQVPAGSHLIHYIGETYSFARRQREHLIHILGMNYGIFDPADAQAGKSTRIWPGLWRDRSADAPERLLERYESLAGVAARYISQMTVFFAPVEGDKKLRRHIEGTIGWNLRNRHPELCTLYPADNQLGRSRTPFHARLHITSAEPVQGLDPELTI